MRETLISWALAQKIEFGQSQLATYTSNPQAKSQWQLKKVEKPIKSIFVLLPKKVLA